MQGSPCLARCILFSDQFIDVLYSLQRLSREPTLLVRMKTFFRLPHGLHLGYCDLCELVQLGVDRAAAFPQRIDMEAAAAPVERRVGLTSGLGYGH